MPAMNADSHSDSPVTRDHRRQWRRCRLVYPVIARRAKGVSIGVNLNLDKRCNFACLYCQIDRRLGRQRVDVDLADLRDELTLAMRQIVSGEIWAEPRFAPTPAPLRRLNDIAFSGDGEPTCLEHFDRAVQIGADVRREFRCDELKLVVITNATKLDSPQFRRALPILDANNGQIWAKLDAGTEDYFQRINRPHPKIALRRVLDNITDVARGRGVVIQSLFFRADGAEPPPAELSAYRDRLGEILDAGGRIDLVQIHTIARPPSSPSASALADAELDAIAADVRSALDGVPVETYYGTDVGPQVEL